MSSSTNTQSVPTASITTLAIFPPTPPASPYITQSDLNNTSKDIHTGIKAFNNNTTSLIVKLLDTNDKQDNKDEKITYISSKLSTYEDRLEKIIINKTQLHILTLQVKYKQENKITELSSKFSTYDDCL